MELEQLNLKDIKQSLRDDPNDDSNGSGLSDDFTHKDKNATLNYLKKMLKQLDYVSDTNRTIPVWPTNLTIKANSFYTFSAINFYAAVLWAVLMASILLLTTYQAHKRNRRLTILETKLARVSSKDQPKNSRKTLQPESKPLLMSELPSKRRIASAINKSSKA